MMYDTGKMTTPPVSAIPQTVKSFVSKRFDAIRHTLKIMAIIRKGTETVVAFAFWGTVLSILVFISGYQAHSGTAGILTGRKSKYFAMKNKIIHKFAEYVSPVLQYGRNLLYGHLCQYEEYGHDHRSDCRLKS